MISDCVSISSAMETRFDALVGHLRRNSPELLLTVWTKTVFSSKVKKNVNMSKYYVNHEKEIKFLNFNDQLHLVGPQKNIQSFLAGDLCKKVSDQELNNKLNTENLKRDSREESKLKGIAMAFYLRWLLLNPKNKGHLETLLHLTSLQFEGALKEESVEIEISKRSKRNPNKPPLIGIHDLELYILVFKFSIEQGLLKGDFNKTVLSIACGLLQENSFFYSSGSIDTLTDQAKRREKAIEVITGVPRSTRNSTASINNAATSATSATSAAVAAPASRSILFPLPLLSSSSVTTTVDTAFNDIHHTTSIYSSESNSNSNSNSNNNDAEVVVACSFYCLDTNHNYNNSNSSNNGFVVVNNACVDDIPLEFEVEEHELNHLLSAPSCSTTTTTNNNTLATITNDINNNNNSMNVNMPNVANDNVSPFSCILHHCFDDFDDDNNSLYLPLLPPTPSIFIVSQTEENEGEEGESRSFTPPLLTTGDNNNCCDDYNDNNDNEFVAINNYSTTKTNTNTNIIITNHHHALSSSLLKPSFSYPTATHYNNFVSPQKRNKKRKFT